MTELFMYLVIASSTLGIAILISMLLFIFFGENDG